MKPYACLPLCSLMLLAFGFTNAYVVQDDEKIMSVPYDRFRSQMLSSNRSPNWKVFSNRTRNLGAVCEECKHVVTELQESLEDEKTVARYKRTLKLICIMTVQSAAKCEAMLEGVDMLFENLKELMKDPDQVCRQLHLCSVAERNVFSGLLLSTLKSLNFEIKGMQGDTPVDFLCDECLFMVNEMVTILSDPDYQRNIQDIAKKMCSIVPQIQDECKSAVDAYSPALFADALQYLSNPKPVCQKMGMCRQFENTWGPLYPVSPNAARSPKLIPPMELEERKPCALDNLKVNGIGSRCLLCQLGLSYILDVMRSDTGIEHLENTAMSLCHSLPSNWTPACLDWVTIYGKPSFQSLLNDINARDICTSMDACTFGDAFAVMQMSAEEKLKTGCDACKLLTMQLSNAKETRYTGGAIKAYALELCEKQPPEMAEKCDETTEMIADKVKEFGAQLKNPAEFCAQPLRFCPSKPILW